MKKIISDFKSFAMRGNVVDMAVGIIIGAAFGKIVSSLVSDVIMPPIGLILGGVDFSDLAFTIKHATETTTAVKINYGLFIQTIIDFIIVAAAVFGLVKAISNLKSKSVEPQTAETPPPAPTPEVKLLTEIRDLLKK